MSVMLSRRLITFSEEIVDGEPIYVSSNSLPIKALKLEPAGYAFHSAALRLSGCVEEKDVKDESKETGKDQETAHTFDSYSNKGKKKSGSGEKQQDHYALLGLSHLRYLATEDQIRKAYREAALRHHPDKQASLLLAEETEAAKEAKKEEIESHFKAIHEGYEVLMDPHRRRIYDSTDEFDDEIPTDCAPQEFFKVFGPTFMRNGRWSVNQPIPSFGDDSTPIQEVDMFYNFWYSFKSWREFPHADEFDIEQAETRDHKRWMERQNAKLSEKARKEETVRIRSLVHSAYERDPRILRRKDEKKAEKLRKKKAKILAKKMQEEEAVRIAEEEKRKKEEEEKRAAETASEQKKLKEKEKKLVRKERSRLRNLSMPVISKHLLDLTDDDVEGICMLFSLEQLRNLCDQIEGKEGIESAKLIKDATLGAQDLKEQKTERKEPQQNGSVEVSKLVASSSNEKKIKSWTREEIELLKKTASKQKNLKEKEKKLVRKERSRLRNLSMPVISKHLLDLTDDDVEGICMSFSLEQLRNLCDQIEGKEGIESAKLIKDATLGAQDLKEQKTERKEPQQNGSVVVSKLVASCSNEKKIKSWTREEIELLKKGILKYPKGTSRRWEVISEFIGTGRSVEEILKATKTVLLQKRKPTASIDSPLSTREGEGVTNGHIPEKKYTKPDNLQGSSSLKTGSQDSVTVNDVSGSDPDLWSAVQERALVQALKTFPKEASQRWERVATAVPGKTVNQCKKKFALMKESFRSKKTGV